MRKLLSFLAIVLFVHTANAQMEFIQNKGQWDSRVEYRGDFSTGSFFLEKNGFRHYGNPWKSNIHENYLGLFLKYK